MKLWLSYTRCTDAVKRNCFLFLLLLICHNGIAQTTFTTVGDAVNTGTNCYRLTTAEVSKKGAVWNNTKIDLNNNFDISFSLNFGNISSWSGADGMAFVLQPVSVSQIGNAGSAKGYGNTYLPNGNIDVPGISPSLDIEYDTYDDYGGTIAYAALLLNGDYRRTPANTGVGQVPIGFVTDGQFHTSRVTWNANTKIMTLYFDGVQKFTYNNDIVNNIFSGQNFVFFGFTASTGGSVNQQSVCYDATASTFSNPLIWGNFQLTDPCSGVNNGSATINFSGGLAPYTVVLDGSNVYPSPIVVNTHSITFNNLAAVYHEIAVFDSNGDEIYGNFTLNSLPVTTPTISASGPTTLCTGGSVVLTASPGTAYLWSTGATTQSIIASTGGSYHVTVTNASCSATSIATTVTINAAPTISASSTIVECIDNPVTLTSSFASRNNLHFGSGSYLEAASIPSLLLTNAFSLDVWIKTDNASATQYILSKGGDDLQNGQYGLLIDGGKIQFHMFQNGHQGGYGTTSLVSGVWYHVVGTWDGNSAKLYVNGNLDMQSTLIAPLTVNNGTLRIGILGKACCPYPFQGNIDEVRIWNRALSAAEAAMQTNIASSPSLVAHYRMDEGLGNTTADDAKNNTATLINQPQWQPSTAPLYFSSYNWSPSGATGPAINVNTGGSYTVTVSDANGCSATSVPVIISTPVNTVSFTTLSVDTDIKNAGKLITANNLGAGATPVSINGVCFSNSPANLSNFFNGSGAFCQDCIPGSNLKKLLDALVFQPNGNESTLTIGGLTNCHRYRLQLIYSNDVNSTGNNINVNVNGVTYSYSNWIPAAKILTIEFTATSSNTVVRFLSNNGAEPNRAVLNGYAVHDLDMPNSSPCNVPPVANAGADINVGAGSNCLGNVTLNGSGSTDADGVNTIVSYTWKEGQTVLGTGVTLSTNLSVGTHTITLEVKDNWGIASTDDVVITVSDLIPPSINCMPSISTNATGPSGTLVNYTQPVGTDNCSGVTTTRTAGLASGSVFPIGVSAVTYTATDAAGLSVSCTFTVTVSGLLPQIVCPANITVGNALGLCGANVSFAATETIGIPASTITYSMAPGSFFNVGTTFVTATATNAVGSSSCSFTVTVLDNENPVLTVPQNITHTADAGKCSFTFATNAEPEPLSTPGNSPAMPDPVMIGSATATDNCGTVTISGIRNDAQSLDAAYPVGVTIITWSVADSHGHTVTGTQTVTITDDEKPVVNCPANQVYCANANGSAIYVIPVLQLADNCGIASTNYVVSGATSRVGAGIDASGSFLPGISTVTWTIVDIHGNSSVCSITVTINALPMVSAISAITNNVCVGAALQLTNASPGGTWSVSDNTIATISPNEGLISAIKQGSIEVMYTITNGNGCTNSVSFALTVHPSPSVPVIIPNGPVVFCPQGSVLLSASVQQVNSPVYTWLPASGVGIGLPDYLVSVTGNYTVTVTNSFGCATTSQPLPVTVQDILPPVPSIPVLPELVLLPNSEIAPPVAADNCKVGTITATTTDPLSYNDAGKYTIHWQYDDGNGNTSSQLQQITILDIVPPEISCIPSITQKNDPAQPGAIVKYTLPFVKDNSSSITISISEGYGDGTITFNTPLTSNVKSLNFISSGNYYDIAHGHGISINVTVELFNPSTNQWNMVQSFQTGTGDYHFGGTVIEFPVMSQVSKIRFTAGQPIGAALHFYALQVNLNSIALVQQSGLASGSFFPLGSTLNRFEATDEAGNKSNCQFTVTVTDNEKPKILNGSSSIKFTTSNCAWSGSGASISITDNSNDPLQLTEQYFTASGYQFISNQFTTVAKGNYQLPTRDFPVGVNTVVLSIRDASGNVSDTVSFTVTVKDNIAPSVIPSGNITRTTDPGICGAYVKVPLPVTQDNCTIQKIENSFTGNTSAVASYPVGTTLITWTVTDVNGNTSTATQTVTVTDKEAPVIYNIPVNIIQTNDAGSCGAKVRWPAVIATDNCRVASFLTNHQSGETFPIGVTMVSFTATDIHGNTSSASFTITITDNEAPRVITKPVTVTLVNGTASIRISDIDGGSVDNCGTVNLSASKTQFSCANAGINNITLTATDNYGNSASSIATVTVIGMVPSPIIQVIPANTLYTGGVPTDIYLGYGPQSVSLSTSVPAGNTVSYSWSGNGLSCNNCASPVFTAVTPGSYTFTVVTTNQYGCSASASITVCVRDIRVSATTGSKVFVCHTDLLTGAIQTLSMSVNSVANQLLQNPLDKLGICGMAPCSAATSMGSVPPPANSNIGKTAKPTTEFERNQTAEDKLAVTASPNPSHEAFRILVKTGNQLPVHIRMIDNYGRITESMQNAPVGKTFRMGEKLVAGIYFAEIIQGKERVVIKLIKQ